MQGNEKELIFRPTFKLRETYDAYSKSLLGPKDTEMISEPLVSLVLVKIVESFHGL